MNNQRDVIISPADDLQAAIRGGGRVRLRGGYYRLRQTVVVNQPLILEACPGEKPVIGAGVPITGWERVDDTNLGRDGSPSRPPPSPRPLWRAPLPAGITRLATLFAGERWLPRARGPGFVPAQSWENHNEHKTDLPFPPGAIPADAAERGGEIRILPTWPWTMNRLPLASVDAARGMATTSVPGTYALGKLRFGHFPNGSCWVENLVEHITGPGQWAADLRTGHLYLWPLGDEPGDDIVAPALTELIRVEGTANVAIRGLRFTHADHRLWTADHVGAGLQHDWEMFDQPTAMLRFRDATDCAVEDCEFVHSGAAGIRCDRRAQRIVIRRNRFAELGGVGVLLAGYGPGTLDENHHNEISHNDIADVGRVEGHAPGIFVWQSGDNRIAHNRLRDTPYTAIVVSGRIVWDRTGQGECSRTIRWEETGDLGSADPNSKQGRDCRENWLRRAPFLHARRNLVEHNDITRCMTLLGDGNGIYVSGAGGGNIVRHNFIHDVDSPTMNAAIRCDDDQHDTVIEGNIIARNTGEGIISKGVNTIRGNIVYDLRPVNSKGERGSHQRGCLVLPFGDVTGSVIEGNIFCATHVETPLLTDAGDHPTARHALRYCRSDYNLWHNFADPTAAPTLLATLQRAGVEQHSIAGDPLFVNAAAGDFRLRPDSPARTLPVKWNGYFGEAFVPPASFPHASTT